MKQFQTRVQKGTNMYTIILPEMNKGMYHLQAILKLKRGKSQSHMFAFSPFKFLIG